MQLQLSVLSERRPRGKVSSINKSARKNKQWLEIKPTRQGRSFLQVITAMPEQDIQDGHEFNTRKDYANDQA